jgi:hypothetical protein
MRQDSCAKIEMKPKGDDPPWKRRNDPGIPPDHRDWTVRIDSSVQQHALSVAHRFQHQTVEASLATVRPILPAKSLVLSPRETLPERQVTGSPAHRISVERIEGTYIDSKKSLSIRLTV